MKIVKIKNNFFYLLIMSILVLSCNKNKTITKKNNIENKLNFQLDSVNYTRFKEYKTTFLIKGKNVLIELSKIYYKNNGEHELYIDDSDGFSKGFIIPFNFNYLAPDGVSITNKLGYNNKIIDDGFIVSFWYSKTFADYIFIFKNGNYYLKEIDRYCQGPKDIYGKQTDTLYIYSNQIFNQTVDKLSKSEIDLFINKDWDNLKLSYIVKK